MSWVWAVVLAVVVLAFTLIAWVAYYLDLGIFEKIEHVLMALAMAVSLVASVWFIAVIIHVRSTA